MYECVLQADPDYDDDDVDGDSDMSRTFICPSMN
jgi:hypothetical protein